VILARSERQSIPQLKLAQMGPTWVILKSKGCIILNAISFAENILTCNLQAHE